MFFESGGASMVETINSSSDSYRDKYRRALDEQEQLEKRFSAQIDLLRKTLLNLSSAAQGLDGHLDSAIAGMRAKFKKGTGAEIVNQLELVQKAVSSFEASRASRSQGMAKDVGIFIDNLLELRLPGDLEKSLKGFNRGLDKRLVSIANYPQVLNELSKLQLLALQAAANPSESFWNRLKGGKTLKDNKAESGNEPNEFVEDELDEVLEGEIEISGESITDELNVSSFDTHIKFDPGSEDTYERVAERIAVTLEGIVNKIEPNELVRHKVDIVKLRIQRGMDWFVLAVTLEDIRDILLLRYLQVDQDFTEYLKRVNNQLHSIGEVLGVAVNKESDFNRSAHEFSERVSKQIGMMEDSLKNNNDINCLKDEVSNNLKVIESALATFNTAQQANLSLSEQLVALVDRVQSIEKESVKTKELLEEERYKATHDPLTGVPNREAYNERAYLEMQRYQRYCRPLTLAICDIDKFKRINDTYGHQAGDKVLKLIAKLIATRIRKVDFLARYGGEEFVVILPETTSEQALGFLDKIRAVVAKTSFKFKSEPVQITISFGLSEFTADDSVETVFERADKALYDAKNGGRNKCVILKGNEDKEA